MIRYNPKEWFTFIFRFHKADTFRKLFPLIVLNCLYAAGIAWLELNILHVRKESHLANLTMMHTLLGLVISLLLVFRTNTAYERWWEGRKLWGSLVNSSRNFALKLGALLPADAKAERDFFRSAIPDFAAALKNHLRNKSSSEEIEIAELQDELRHKKHVPNQLAALMAQRLQELVKHGTLSETQMLFLNTELQNFTDVCGGCERIRNTPIPFSYSVFLKKFIFFYVMTLPFSYAFSLGYWIVPVVGFFFYVLASLELIAEEIEDPFGSDANDLPIDEITRGIRNAVKDLL
jgi:ion channel-forming bestrophin family protein